MRRLFVPEAIQTSAMDCGPASLKALLEGHGIQASYGRLREACQTGVDGTSIDHIEVAAGELGLAAEQIMVPADHLLRRESSPLPALVVTRQPGGLTHFVVVWSTYGDWVQIMDPGAGRRWMRKRSFLAEVYTHRQPVDAADWQDWASTSGFLDPLRARLNAIGRAGEALIGAACSGEPLHLARLDAAARMTAALIECGALERGAATEALLARLAAGEHPIPEQYWFAAPDAEDPAVFTLRGAVLLSVRGRTGRAAPPSSPELAAALSEKPARPLRQLGAIALDAGRLGSIAVTASLAAAAAGTIIEALLFRGFFDLGRQLSVTGQRIGALAALIALSAVMLALEFFCAAGVLRIGRRLESAIRVRFLTKLPRLGDRYFQSRPASDMASRSHQVHQLRRAPDLAASFLRCVFEIGFTTAALVWLYPASAVPVALLAVLCIGIPLAFQPALSERELRMRTHAGALSQVYLDALLGLVAIRAHGAEPAIRRRQEDLLGPWASAGLSLQRMVTIVEGLRSAATLGLAAWIVRSQFHSGAEPAGLLLLVYWVLNLPSLGQDAAAAVWQYPSLRNTALRILEPLGAPQENEAPARETAPAEAVAIQLDHVTVRAAGHVILDDVSLSIPAGSHVAVVGASGAGKSSLAGLLLGWHSAEQGQVLVDGCRLDAAGLRNLRENTAWIDPQVQIWNQSMFDNLRYGAPAEQPVAMGRDLEDACLRPVLEKLPEGMQTKLGEGGALVSGGEGQRVRIGRAFGRNDAGLVILDEPARGLDAARRRGVLECARERWRNSTLLAITHDIRDTRDFDRVVVIDGGRIVEDGDPAMLASDKDSHYRRLLDAEYEVRNGLWASPRWRRVSMRSGRLSEQERRTYAAVSE
jgi:ATP-binding cassette subfamily B protein